MVFLPQGLARFNGILLVHSKKVEKIKIEYFHMGMQINIPWDMQKCMSR